MTQSTRDIARPAVSTAFRQVHIEWLEARASVDRCSTTNANHNDEAMNAALDHLAAAEWKLIRTPAGAIADISTRGRVVQQMTLYDAEAGEPTDNRTKLMLATLVAELAAGGCPLYRVPLALLELKL
jgi:hypothetical protein